MKLPPTTARLASAMTWAHAEGARGRFALRRARLFARRHPALLDFGLPCAGFMAVGVIVSGAAWIGCLILAGALSVALGCALELTRGRP